MFNAHSHNNGVSVRCKSCVKCKNGETSGRPYGFQLTVFQKKKSLANSIKKYILYVKLDHTNVCIFSRIVFDFMRPTQIV